MRFRSIFRWSDLSLWERYPRGAAIVLLVSLVGLLLSYPASALMFTREEMRVQTTPTREGEVVMVRPTIPYSMEVRSSEALRLDYIHTLNTLTETTGVVITLAQPASMPLPYLKVPTPVDALFVTADGRITQVLPGVVLGNVSQVATPREPIRAFVFLKNGQAAARGIRPGATIAGSMFTPTAP